MSRNMKGRGDSRKEILDIIQDLEEPHTFSADEAGDLLFEMVNELQMLSEKYLCNCNSSFYFVCYDIAHPAVCDFDPHALPLHRTMDHFIRKVLGGPFGDMIPLTSDPRALADIEYLKQTTSGPVHKKNLFTRCILDTLVPLGAELYNPTATGWKRFSEPIVFPYFIQGFYLVSVRDKWYVLTCWWSD